MVHHLVHYTTLLCIFDNSSITYDNLTLTEPMFYKKRCVEISRYARTNSNELRQYKWSQILDGSDPSPQDGPLRNGKGEERTDSDKSFHRRAIRVFRKWVVKTTRFKIVVYKHWARVWRVSRLLIGAKGFNRAQLNFKTQLNIIIDFAATSFKNSFRNTKQDEYGSSTHKNAFRIHASSFIQFVNKVSLIRRPLTPSHSFYLPIQLCHFSFPE